jgi:ATP adenylyltransferase/5',5'''-P-1,P-4-tetraphosphate phosphorylase II
MKSNIMMAKMYDGSLRQIVGTLEIHHSYNMLLERSWIHVVRATTSSLHQCLKYIMNRMLV